jgi:hypothetical protein
VPAGSPAPSARTRPSALAVLGALGATVTLVSGVLGIVFVLLPQSKPKAPPGHTAVHLSQVSFDRGVTFEQYLAREGQPAGGLDRRTLDRRGELFTVHFDIVGYERKRLPLRWHLLDLRGGRQLGHEGAITITGTAERDEGDYRLWVPAPRRRGHYAIDVELRNPPDAVTLATLRSPTFAR